MTVEIWVWHEDNFRHVFKSWEGPVGRHIDRLGRDTIFRAGPLIGREYAAESTRSGTRRLQRSLDVVHRFARNGDVEARAGANPSGRRKGYALWHHEPTGVWAGRGKYPIRPRRRGGTLRFYWRRAGRTVVFRQVRHPGSRGQHYLTRALRSVIN